MHSRRSHLTASPRRRFVPSLRLLPSLRRALLLLVFCMGVTVLVTETFLASNPSVAKAPPQLRNFELPEQLLNTEVTYAEMAPFPIEDVRIDDSLNAPLARQACSDGSARTLVFIETHPKYLHRRFIIRGAFDQMHVREKLGWVVVFIVGLTTNAMKRRLLTESTWHGDIAQLPFLDTYSNLTYKTIYAIRWVLTHCRNVAHVVKLDDDVMVNPFGIQKLLRELPQGDESFYGRSNNRAVLRDLKNKNYMSVADYPLSTYPEYCAGQGYMFRSRMLPLLLLGSFYVPIMYKNEDVYTNGLLRRLSQFRISWLDGVVLRDVKLDLTTKSLMMASHDFDVRTLVAAWKKLLRHLAKPKRGDHDVSFVGQEAHFLFA